MTKLIAEFRDRLGGQERVSALECALVAGFLIIALVAVIPGLGVTLDELSHRIFAALI